jgi:hypothetical protein
MSRISWLLAAGFMLASTLGAQEEHQPPGGQRAPALAPTPAPSLYGHRTDTVNDYRKLSRIRSLYISGMDNDLAGKLVETIGKLGLFKIAPTLKEADAVMTGSCLESRRLKRLHSEVFIADRGGSSVWQDNIYRPYNPPSLEKAVSETAKIVAEHLDASLHESTAK